MDWPMKAAAQLLNKGLSWLTQERSSKRGERGNDMPPGRDAN
jgi:hypothetical protein